MKKYSLFLFWLSLGAISAAFWGWLVWMLADTCWAIVAAVMALCVTMVSGSLCCASGNRTNEYISQEAAHGVFDED